MTFHVQLCDVNIEAQISKSFDVRSGRVVSVVKQVHINMCLKPNTIDATISFLQVFDKVEDLISLRFLPSRPINNIVIIVEKLNLGVGCLRSFEDFTNQIWNVFPNAFLEKLIVVITDGLVDCVPGIWIVSYCFDSLGDVFQNEAFKFGIVGFLVDEMGVSSPCILWSKPDEIMASHLHVVFAGVG